MSEWQPIETAPLDDAEVLLCNVRGRDRPVTGSYFGDDLWLGTCGGDPTYSSDGFHKILRPTHWMPIPAPPEIA